MTTKIELSTTDTLDNVPTAIPRNGNKHQRIFTRMKVILLALLGLLTVFIVIPSSAVAASGGGCSSAIDSGYNWSEDACISWTGSYIRGDTDVYLGANFNSANVRACDIQATVISSYGTATTQHFDCTAAVQTFSIFDVTWNFGPGRQAGDRYTVHSCMTVTTGVVYSSCSGPHPGSPYLTL